ncbi:cobyric acid synthase [Sporichthya brevicatena]|uniref:Cobyric acid synthase n=1 Tax=Sporichthya brevicatena TaxID=171442 RepID=A0ABP3S1W9_9ACTN
MKGALLVAGTTSDAGKSVLTAGLCRWLHRRGVAVAPFKAQNMSNNSAVTPDGAEIGRAQAMQAAAAGLEPEAAMNPVLLKPGSDRSSQVVLLGEPVADVTARSYRDLKPKLMSTVLDSLADLRSRYDVVVCEGAGSPAEINLRADDIANMGLARAADLPVVVVGDIDRGGVLAAMFGTLAVLDPADQALIAGFVVNKFRGDPSLLAPGLDRLRELTGRPTYGVLPWLPNLWLDAEDSLTLDAAGPAPGTTAAAGADVLRVAAVRLPRISNLTDLDALAAEPGVVVRFVTAPEELGDADLVVLPGTRATVTDLAWLRECGLADAVVARAAAGRPVLGVCGGYQMLARTITDDVESRAGAVAGLGLLPADVVFEPRKTVGRTAGEEYGQPVRGYEIHHGRVRFDAGTRPFLDGCRAGAVWGTTWHGALESDAFRRAFLAEVAAAAGRDFRPVGEVSFAAVREARLDVLGDLVADHLDAAALDALIGGGAPRGLPVLRTVLGPEVQ